MFAIDHQLLILGLLVLFATTSSKLSTRGGIPFLLVFVLIGMLAGSEGLGGIAFTDFSLAHAVATSALILILFDGGLRTSIDAVRRAALPAGLLATVGVVITAGTVGVATWLLLDLPLPAALLLGSIIGSTDAAAVFTALRTSGLQLRPRLASTLEVESGSNDPMAVLLTVGLLEFSQGRMAGVEDWVMFFVQQLAFGAGLGLLAGRAIAAVLNRIDLPAAGLYPLLTLAAALATYGITAALGGSGILAVYLAGIVVGNRHIVFKRGIWFFHDGLAWLGQIVMFVVLGMLSFPSQVVEVWDSGLLTAFVLTLVARPLAVVTCLAPLRFDWRELVFVAWAGLKGAVPVILATYPFLFGLEGAGRLFHLVFFVVLVSVLIQGWSLPLVARLLHVDAPELPRPPVALEIVSVQNVDADIVAYHVEPETRAANKPIGELGLPDGVAITMLVRDRDLVVPRGNVVVQPGDHVFVMLRPKLRWLADHVFTKHGTTLLRAPIPGRVKLADLRKNHGIDLQDDEAQTLDEFIRKRLGAYPRRGEFVKLGLVALKVLETDSRGRVLEIGLHLADNADAVPPAREAESQAPSEHDAPDARPEPTARPRS